MASARLAAAGTCRIANAPTRAAAPHGPCSALKMGMSMLSLLVQVSDARIAVQNTCVAVGLRHVLPKSNAGVFPACALGEALTAFELLQPAADGRLRTADERGQSCLRNDDLLVGADTPPPRQGTACRQLAQAREKPEEVVGRSGGLCDQCAGTRASRVAAPAAPISGATEASGPDHVMPGKSPAAICTAAQAGAATVSMCEPAGSSGTKASAMRGIKVQYPVQASHKGPAKAMP